MADLTVFWSALRQIEHFWQAGYDRKVISPQALQTTGDGQTRPFRKGSGSLLGLASNSMQEREGRGGGEPRPGKAAA